jgi:uncharacterized protein
MMESLQLWWAGIDWQMLGVWTLTICLLIVGVVGAIVPLLPGPMLLFVAGVLHTLLRPESGMSAWGIALLCLLFVLAYVVDIASSAMGAKWFGASRWGVAGVLIGGIVGLFFGIPGLLIGPVAGGLAFEVFLAKRDFRSGMKSTWGSVVGTGVGLITRVLLSLAMVLVFLVDALWW